MKKTKVFLPKFLAHFLIKKMEKKNNGDWPGILAWGQMMGPYVPKSPIPTTQSPYFFFTLAQSCQIQMRRTIIDIFIFI